MSNRAFYSAPLEQFLVTGALSISGEISAAHTQQLQHQLHPRWPDHWQSQLIGRWHQSL